MPFPSPRRLMAAAFFLPTLTFCADLFANHPDAVPEPVIVVVDDVPGDSGGWLRITWRHSKWDWHPYHDVRSYRVLRYTPGGQPLWQEVRNEPALAIQTYTATVPALAPNGYTKYIVRAMNLDGTVFWDSAADSGFALDNISGVGDPTMQRFRLEAAFPNPGRTRTTLRFYLPATLHVDLTIHDIRGRLIRTLVDQDLSEGAHEFQWDGKTDAGERAGAGAYFTRLRTARGILFGRVLWID